MKPFGPKKAKPPTVARFGGMRILPADPPGITTTQQNIVDLRHASALSAAVANNISSTLNQPGDPAQGSDSFSEESFLDAHSRYSFITVLTLMSLFMVVTISATSFMLAFYRKKNAVFAASSKSDADSQLELDDFDNTDIETCRGDKGECYVQLSEESDDDVHDVCCDNREVDGRNTAGRRTTRSMTFPQLHEVLTRRKSAKTCSSHREGTVKDRPVTNALTPLIRPIDFSSSNSTKPRLYHVHQHQCNHREEVNKLSYQNLNHQHDHHQHPPTHQQCPRCNNCQKTSSSTVRLHRGPCHKHHLPCNGLAKLRRSHTIHAIPQSDTGLQSRSLLRAGYHLKTREYNTARANHHINRSVKATPHAASNAAHSCTHHRVLVDQHLQTTSSSQLPLDHTIHREGQGQASHRSNPSSTKDEPYPASGASHSYSHGVGAVIHPHTQSCNHLQLHHNHHQDDDPPGSHLKKTSSAKRESHAASGASHSSNHRVAVVPHHQTTSSHHLQRRHNTHQEYDACKTNPAWNPEDGRTHTADSRSSSSSHRVGHHKAHLNRALLENEHDQTRVTAPSLPPTTTHPHPCSATTTPFYPHMLATSSPHMLATSSPHVLATSSPHMLATSSPHMLATSSPHSPAVSPQENSTVILSTAASQAKFSNSQSPLRASQSHHATEASTGPLNSPGDPDLSSPSISHTRRSTASTSDPVNPPPPPPHKSSSKRQHKPIKDGDKNSDI